MKDSQNIVLTNDEFLMAAMHGTYRRFKGITNKRVNHEEGKRTTWDNEIEAACAELAFCKFNGYYWDGLSHLGAADGGGFEVRWTGLERGNLLLYNDDIDERIYVLMGGFAPRYHIVGSMRAIAGKQSQFLTEHGYYRVPRELLRPPRAPEDVV
jgi:hypothetical protein